MMYYKVVFAGENIFFENQSANPDPSPHHVESIIETESTIGPEPIIGFISCQYIRAESEDLAVAIAKRDLLVNWNQSFNADRKLGMPKLTLQHIVTVNRWLKPKTTDDYHWFTSDAHKQAQLSKMLEKTSRWFNSRQ